MKALLLCPFILLTPSCVNQDILGFSFGQRLQIYGAALDIAGHPEFGVPVAAVGRGLGKQPRNVNPSGK